MLVIKGIRQTAVINMVNAFLLNLTFLMLSNMHFQK